MGFEELFQKVTDAAGVPAAVVAAVATVLGAIFTLVGALVAAILSYRVTRLQHGEYRKQIQGIDLATKRIEFWNEYLKLSELADSADDERHKRAKDEASTALARIRSEADAEMARLSWENQITRSIREQSHNLKSKDKPLFWSERILSRRLWSYLLFLILNFGFAGMIILVGYVVATTRWKPPIRAQLLMFALFTGWGLSVAWLRREAEREKYEKPEPPFLDQV